MYKNELGQYKTALNRQDFESAWHHLERAHIIGQRYPYQHTETHWKMLLLAIRTGNCKEVLGQTVRLILGAPFSFIDKVPIGNIGSTRVSMVKPQQVPEDIVELFSEVEK